MFLPRQTDLFEGQDDYSQMELRLGHLEVKFGNVQRGLFARHKKMEDVQAELFKLVIDLKEEMAKIRELMIYIKK